MLYVVISLNFFLALYYSRFIEFYLLYVSSSAYLCKIIQDFRKQKTINIKKKSKQNIVDFY